MVRLEVVAQLFFYVRRTSGHLSDFSRMLVFTSTPGQQLHGCRCEQPRHTTSLDSTFRRQGTPGHTLPPLAPGPGCLLVPFPSYAAAFIALRVCSCFSTLVSIPSTGPTALSAVVWASFREWLSYISSRCLRREPLSRMEVVAQLFFYVRRTSGHLPDFSRMLVFHFNAGSAVTRLSL